MSVVDLKAALYPRISIDILLHLCYTVVVRSKGQREAANRVIEERLRGDREEKDRLVSAVEGWLEEQGGLSDNS